MSEPRAAVDRTLERVEGRAPSGIVTLRDFDQGVVETLGAVAGDMHYLLTVAGVDPPPGFSGIPVVFSFPEDTQVHHYVPSILVRRDTMDPAMQRWHPGLMQYRAPAAGAVLRSVQVSNGTSITAADRYDQMPQAVPFDFGYTLQIYARHRGAPGQKNQANAILNHVLRVYPPYCRVVVKDSIDEVRTYEAMLETVSPMDEVAEVSNRLMGFMVSLRVYGELDLVDPETYKSVTSLPTLRTHMLK